MLARLARGGSCDRMHHTTARWVDDLPAFDRPTRLLVHRRRLDCPHCGPKSERLRWLDHYQRCAARLAESVARWCKLASIKHAACQYGIGWDRTERIARELGPVDLSGVTILAMNEFAIHKGHRCATAIVDPTCKRVLWIGRGRGRHLMTVYVLKDDLKPLRDYQHEGTVRSPAASSRRRSLPGSSAATSRTSSRTVTTRYTPGYLREYPTRSRPSSESPTGIGTTSISFSTSGKPSPEFADEPDVLLIRKCQANRNPSSPRSGHGLR